MLQGVKISKQIRMPENPCMAHLPTYILSVSFRW